MRTARPTADEHDDCAQHPRCKSSHGPGGSLSYKQRTFQGPGQPNLRPRGHPHEPHGLGVLDDRTSQSSPFGDAIDTFIRREDAERFIEAVRGDDPELASYLRIEERELETGGLN
jgi:hypothetical protein